MEPDLPPAVKGRRALKGSEEAMVGKRVTLSKKQSRWVEQARPQIFMDSEETLNYPQSCAIRTFMRKLSNN